MADINLLSGEEKKDEGFENLRKKLSVGAVLLLVFTAVSTLATLAYFTTLVSARSELISRVEETSAKVNNFKSTEELVVVTKEKATVASEILAQRSDKVETFNTLAQIVPQNVTFSDVKIAQGKFVVNGQAKTSADIAGFVSSLVSSKGAQILSDVSIDSLVSDERGVYSFGISANLIK